MNDSFSLKAGVSEKIEILLPYISASDLMIAGSGDISIGLRYDDENMFAPIIIFLEQSIPVEALKTAASGCGVPFMENDSLARNLFFYGRLGEAIPDLCCRDIAAIMARTSKKPASPAAPLKTANLRELKLSRPVKLEMGSTLMAFLGNEKALIDGLSKIQKRISGLLGYTLPSISAAENPRLKEGEYRIMFRGIEAGRGSLELGWYRTVDLGLGIEQISQAAGAAAVSLAAHIDELVQKRAPELLGRDEVQAILNRAEKKYPVVTGEVKSLLSLGSIRDILRGLLSEQVSIRHIQQILETLADWGSFGPAPNEIIIEQIRQSLKRQICLEYTDEKQTLRVLTLENKLEQGFSEKSYRETQGHDPGFNPEGWLEAFSPPVKKMEEMGYKPVVLCSPSARSWVKEFTRIRFPNLAVLSYIEIPSDINVEAVDEITLNSGQEKPKRREIGS